MSKNLLPVKKEFPKPLSELREALENLEGDVFINKGNISILKNTIYNGGADIDKVGNFLGSGKLPPSSNSVKEALTSINNDFKSSFKNTSTVIGHLNDNLSNTLNIIKNMIICMGIITYNQRRDKKASEKAVKRLKDVTERIKRGEISVSELIDIFAENVETEAKEYKQLEDKLSQLQLGWQNIQKELNDKLQTLVHEAESLKKSHDSYITDLNGKLSVSITEIKNKQEEASSLLKNEQKESLDRIDKLVNENLAKAEEKTTALERSQEEFVSQIKKQTSQALDTITKKREDDTVAMHKEQKESLDRIDKLVNENLAKTEEKTTALERSQEEFVSQIKKQTSQALDAITKKREDDTEAMQKEQKESLDRIDKLVNENLAKAEEKTNALERSQEKFVSQSNEQTSFALSEFQKEAEQKTAAMQEQTIDFMENQNTLFVKMNKQLIIYKVVSIVAIITSLFSLLYTLL